MKNRGEYRLVARVVDHRATMATNETIDVEGESDTLYSGTEYKSLADMVHINMMRFNPLNFLSNF